MMHPSWETIPPEQRALAAKCFHPTGVFAEFKREEIEQSISDRFEKVVSVHAGRVAIKTREEILTYDALNKRANRIAWAIRKARGDHTEPVALVSRSPSTVVAGFMGILKAGKLVVIIDPSIPFVTARAMIESSGAEVVLADSESRALAERLTTGNLQLLNSDALETDLPQANPALRISPDAPVQIVYSSGSTGAPKGIFFNHRRMLHDIMVYVNAIHLCPDDRLVQLRKLSFGAGIKDLFRALLNGAGLYPYALNESGIAGLPRFLAEEEITIYSPGVSVYRPFIDALTGAEAFPSIRLLVLGGGGVSGADVEAYRRVFSPGCLLLHHLSSTETGLVSQYFVDKETSLAGPMVPAGYPIEGKEVFLLDENGARVDPNGSGEIAVKSQYISSGYWRNSDLTDAKFLFDAEHPGERVCLTGDLGRLESDGCLFHLGRKDFVLKVRGHRVDIAEVEQALLGHPGLKEAGVAAWERQSGDKYLAAYIVARASDTPGPSELRAFLRKSLPDYMIPAAFIPMSSLPLTNRKLDRKALPRPDGRRPALPQPYVPPRTEIEQKLAEVWEDTLDVHPVGVQDSFFDLGGHSLAAAAIVANLNAAFGVQLSLRALLDAPTVSELAAATAALCGSEETAEQRLRRGPGGEENGEI